MYAETVRIRLGLVGDDEEVGIVKRGDVDELDPNVYTLYWEMYEIIPSIGPADKYALRSLFLTSSCTLRQTRGGVRRHGVRRPEPKRRTVLRYVIR